MSDGILKYYFDAAFLRDVLAQRQEPGFNL